MPPIEQTYNIIVTGVGGTGIVTVGGILGMAAHLEGRGVGVLDMAGFAQKGGAVFTHIRFAEKPEDIHAVRVAAGRADLVLGGDIVVAGTEGAGCGEARRHPDGGQHRRILPGEFTRNADFSLPSERLKRTIVRRCRRRQRRISSMRRGIATALFGQSIGANMFLVGYAYQLGAIPLSAAAIEKAVELNGEAVAMNKAAFHWGRRAAVDPRRASKHSPSRRRRATSDAEHLSESFEETVERRVKFLTAYQNAAYAAATGPGGQGQSGGSGARPRQGRAGRRGGALSVQTDGV